MILSEVIKSDQSLKGAKIGLVTPRYAPSRGGVELHVEKVATGLARQGLEVEVITLDPTGQAAPEEWRDGVLIHRFGVVQMGQLDLISPSALRWLYAQIGRFDLLHVHSYHTPLAVQLAALNRRWQRPLVVTPHYHGTGHTAFRNLLHRPYRLAGSWLMKQATAILAVSSYEQNLLRHDFGPQLPVKVVPNGVELNSSSTNILSSKENTSTDIKLLSVGRLEHYKQTDRIVETLAKLPPNYKLSVVGVGPELPRLERLAAQLGVEHQLNLTGAVSQAELQRLYAESQLFISLSRHEAFGLTLLEAAVAGAKVIASDIGAYREVASYLPTEVVSFIDQNCTPGKLAEQIERRVKQPYAMSGATLTLPTWEKTTVTGVLACYKEVLSCDPKYKSSK